MGTVVSNRIREVEREVRRGSRPGKKKNRDKAHVRRPEMNGRKMEKRKRKKLSTLGIRKENAEGRKSSQIKKGIMSRDVCSE